MGTQYDIPKYLKELSEATEKAQDKFAEKLSFEGLFISEVRIYEALKALNEQIYNYSEKEELEEIDD